MAEKSSTRSCDGALLILTTKTDSTGWFGMSRIFCVAPLHWKHEAVILNNSNQKCTIGTGENLNSFNAAKYGEFLTFRNNADVAEEQCQIVCDTSGTFWLQSLQGRTFLNGKLVRDSPVKLKFGDIFHFSHIFSTCLDSLVIHLANRRTILYRRNSRWKEYAVFKFDRMTCNAEEERKAETNSVHDLDIHPIFENHIILTKIFEHVVNSNIPWDQRDLLNCRLVS
ncbi:hypothetical protein Fcan01_20297 [Folsomia candida]|uniref:FHA domain-containing protein n=1 Tax=Folsomia candida TaxID=158441 RepID=A0A226DJ05_FOLCA|nr:hypothetical protein Fcan01_20297 [Folsomia candida]